MNITIYKNQDGYTVNLAQGMTYTSTDLDMVIKKIRYEYRLFAMPLKLKIVER